jgi:hypothetical protein
LLDKSDINISKCFSAVQVDQLRGDPNKWTISYNRKASDTDDGHGKEQKEDFGNCPICNDRVIKFGGIENTIFVHYLGVRFSLRTGHL